jgi:tetratricopeptide (TPR) repeat protein
LIKTNGGWLSVNNLWLRAQRDGRVAMPGIAELVDRGADLTALRLLARTDRSALAATLKELGYSKMGHRMELEKALLLDPPAEATGKPPAQAPGKPPAEALGKATAARVARLLVAEAEAAASAGRVAAAKRLWGQVAVLSPAHATERPRVDAEATRPLAEATAAAVVEAVVPVAVAAPEAAVGQLSAESAVPAENPASAQAASLRAEGSEAYRDGRHGRAEDLYTRALTLTPGDAALLSNRSAARLQLGRAAAALEDALAAAAARPGWGKAQLRAAAAYEAMGEAEAAVASYEAAARCEALGQQALTSLARLRARRAGGELPCGGGSGGTAADTQLVVGGVAAAREAIRLGQMGDALVMLDAVVRRRRSTQPHLSPADTQLALTPSPRPPPPPTLTSPLPSPPPQPAGRRASGRRCLLHTGGGPRRTEAVGILYGGRPHGSLSRGLKGGPTWQRGYLG